MPSQIYIWSVCYILYIHYMYIKVSKGGERGLVVGHWTCNPEVPGSYPPSSHWMDLFSVAPNSALPDLVNSQLVSLPSVVILTLLCLICIVFLCNAHLIIFTWNLRDINVNYYYYYYYYYYKWCVMLMNGRKRDVTSPELRNFSLKKFRFDAYLLVSKFETRLSDFVWVLILSSRAVSGESMDSLYFRFLFVFY